MEILATKSKFKVRTVRTKEERKRPSVFMRLKTDEAFRGIALFEPDPEQDDNPGYLEYYDHWDQQGQQYVPCAGDKCPFCAANDNPSTRALTVWYFPDEDVKDAIKVFTMNYNTINEIADEAEEEDGILGKKIRIKRLSDKGDYRVKISGDKPLSKSEMKKAQGLLDEKFPDGLEALVQRQLVAQMERLKALEALEEDDEDEDEEEEEETPRRRRRAPVAEAEAEEEEDEDEEEEEEEEPEAEAEEDEEEEEEEEEEEISGGVFEILKTNERDEILELKGDDGKVKMWVGDGVEVDYDEAKVGAMVKIDATADDEGDMIITSLTVTKPKRGRGRPKGSKTKSKK